MNKRNSPVSARLHRWIRRVLPGLLLLHNRHHDIEAADEAHRLPRRRLPYRILHGTRGQRAAQEAGSWNVAGLYYLDVPRVQSILHSGKLVLESLEYSREVLIHIRE